MDTEEDRKKVQQYRYVPISYLIVRNLNSTNSRERMYSYSLIDNDFTIEVAFKYFIIYNLYFRIQI